jgi:phosphoglycolate phosphatase-like HAD superfamily hydrolase
VCLCVCVCFCVCVCVFVCVCVVCDVDDSEGFRCAGKSKGADADADLASIIGRHRAHLLRALCLLLAQLDVILVVVSFNSRKVISPVLQQLDVLHYFHAIYDHAAILRVAGGKEAPGGGGSSSSSGGGGGGGSVGDGRKQALLAHLMLQHNVSAENCVLVDDDNLNLAGAACKTVLVRGGRGLGPLEVRGILDSLRLLAHPSF